VEANGDRPRYFVLVYDSSALRVLSLSGHGHDFTGAVLTLTGRVQEHRRRPEVVVRLLSAADLPDLLARHAELFEELTFPDA
jgi:DNA/RNA endonuclease YhcR with UshA esterase domain